MVGRRAAALLGGAVLSLTMAAPAQAAGTGTGSAAINLRGSVTAGGTTLKATCHYSRMFQTYDYSDTSQLTGFAVSAPEGFVRMKCTVTPRAGYATAEASGLNHAAVTKTVELHGGPTTICVEATSTHLVPSLNETVSACTTYQD